MGLSLAQLIPSTALDRVAWLGKLLLGYQGLGFPYRPAGNGSGTMSASGVSSVIETVSIKITTAGEPGTAQYALSTDGISYGIPTSMPSNGTVVLSGTGVTLQFAAGPSGGGTSFVVGDIFSVDLSTPTLPVSSWQPGSTPLTITQVFADAIAELGRTVASIAKGGFVRYATGPWLDLVATNVYNLVRGTGVVGHRTLRLTDIAGVGPITLLSNSLWVGTPGGLRWTNTAGVTIPLAGAGLGHVDVDFAAETFGALYNVGGGLITTFFTSLPGVSVSDPAGVATITTAGQDAESDASLAARCLARWPSLGVAAPNENYDLWAKSASPNVTRTKIRASLTIPGQVEVYLAGAAGAVDGATVTAVNAYIQMRLGVTTTALVQSATAVPQNITATVYCDIGSSASVAAAISQNLTALIVGGVDVLGEMLPPVNIGGTLFVNQVIEQLETPQGVWNSTLAVPAAPVALGATSVMGLGTFAITLVEGRRP
jgi:uncharacterized phage protein gp47/JayE